MDLKLQGKAAVVTAASKGIGRAIAEKLAEEGANLLICSRNEAEIAAVADDISGRFGVKAVGIAADVGDPAAILRLQERAAAEFGRTDALVCNAGGPVSGSFLSLSDSDWEQAFQTNLMSVVRLVRAFVPLMRENGGRIVTIASVSIKTPLPGLVLSNTLRAGVAGLMKTLSIELAEYGILVNTVCPGRISTDRIRELDEARAARENISVEQLRENAVKEIPLGRFGEPHELAALAAFLLSPVNSYMTGSSFFVDGGSVKAL